VLEVWGDSMQDSFDAPTSVLAWVVIVAFHNWEQVNDSLIDRKQCIVLGW
jgi:hypothetical protein